jgi:hypothetical protein
LLEPFETDVGVVGIDILLNNGAYSAMVEMA